MPSAERLARNYLGMHALSATFIGGHGNWAVAFLSINAMLLGSEANSYRAISNIYCINRRLK